METKHTPGPWRWEVSEKTKQVQLCGGERLYDDIVLDAKRWGMQGGQIRLSSRHNTNLNNMYGVSEYAICAPGREHHADWFKVIDHPDALLIQAAPLLLEAAIAALDDLKVEGVEHGTVAKMLKNAIDQATGKGKIDSTR